MRIKSLISFSMIIALAAVLAMTAVNWYFFQRLQAISVVEDKAKVAALNVSHLLLRTHEFVLYSEERAAQQWYAHQASLVNVLQSGVSDEVALSPHALAEAEALPSYFTMLNIKVDGNTDFREQQKSFLVDRLLNSTQLISDSVQRWADSASLTRKKVERKVKLLTFFVPLMTLLILTIFDVILIRAVLRPLKTLHEAVLAAEKGDLTTHTDSKKNDEIGDLSRSFNKMAVKLVSELKQEIAEHKRAVEELRSTRDVLQAAMDQSPAGIAIADAPDGTLRYVNDAGLLIRGGTRESVVNGIGVDKYVARWRLFDFDNRPLNEDEVPLARAIKYGECSTREFIIRRDEGDDRVVLANAAPIFGQEGKVKSAIVVFTDMSERIKAESERNQLTESLKQKNADLEQFAYVASHDLQEPLRTIISYLQLLERSLVGKLEDETKEFIDQVILAANRLKALIDDLLEYSRLGHSQSRTTSVDLNQVVEKVLRDNQALINETATDVQAGELPTIEGFQSSMFQLFSNLVSNAIKFRRKDVAPVIRIDAKSLDGFWEITVTDNGIGIDKQYLEKIFVVFQRLHPRSVYPGTGIGLALCEKIVKAHSGRIQVESVPGEGSTFRIQLPRRK